MSSPAQGGPSVPKDKEKEKRGFGKVLMRVKTVFKKADPSRRLSTLSAKAGATGAGAATSDAAAAAVPAAVEATKVPRSQLFAERAKKLGEAYGLELKPSEWHTTEGTALRVEKPIRMRVHRKCHVCGASFGVSKECSQCKHQRCKQCPRVPPKRTEAQKEESRKKRAAILKERAENAPIIPDWNPDRVKIVELKRPAKTGGQDLVYRKPRQRVRRTCCICQKLFTSGNKTCEGCQHTRCTDCPRDPPKKANYPYGYPGDAPSARVVHYRCPACKHVFSAPPAGTAACTRCSHSKCERQKPKKVDPEPDPEVWKSVQAKLEQLQIK